MKELLKKLKIVQEVSNEERHKLGLKRLGQGYFKAYRLNPLNPLSLYTCCNYNSSYYHDVWIYRSV